MPHLLVVDDDATIRALLERFLSMAGHTVTAAPDGQDALELLDKVTPDLVMTDLEMPLMGGRELLDSLRLLHPGLPVVGMSGDAGKYPGLPEQFDAFVDKPFKLNQVLSIIAASLEPAASG